jgi:hypothetical protein
MGCDLGNTGCATELLRQLPDGRTQPQMQFLAPAGRPDRPRAIAEVPLQLTFDRRRRERGELEIATGIETLNCLQQPDECHLLQIVELFTAIREAARDMCGEALVSLDEFVSELPLAGSPVLDELCSLHLSRVGAHARDAYPGRTVQLKQTFPSAISIL